MKRLFLYVAACLVFQSVNAADFQFREEEKIGHVSRTRKANNLCCHWCRISQKRTRSAGTTYKGCAQCPMSYCTSCINKFPKIEPDASSCLVCKKDCCCSFDCCSEEHQHCFTHRRTKQRHAAHNSLKWSKKKRKWEVRDETETISCSLQQVENCHEQKSKRGKWEKTASQFKEESLEPKEEPQNNISESCELNNKYNPDFEFYASRNDEEGAEYETEIKVEEDCEVIEEPQESAASSAFLAEIRNQNLAVKELFSKDFLKRTSLIK